MGFAEIKTMMMENDSSIVDLLDEFDFHHISRNSRELRFARSEDGGPNIQIRLQNNPWIAVNDFVRGVHNDIFAYIVNEKNVELRTVLRETRKILGLSEDWTSKKVRKPFGGLYENVGKRLDEYSVKTYGEDILDKYDKCGNFMWVKDGIDLITQRKFDICYSKEEENIIIPWRSATGEIIAIKNRVNGDPEEGCPKYFYSVGGTISSSLYGYFQNYPYIQGDTIYCGESEKFCLQLASMGYRNAVGLGSNTLSKQQAALLLSANPKKIVWMLDEGLPKENTLKNAEMIRGFRNFGNIEQYWWNWKDSLCIDEGSKMSPSDDGKATFDDIINYELEEI